MFTKRSYRNLKKSTHTCKYLARNVQDSFNLRHKITTQVDMTLKSIDNYYKYRKTSEDRSYKSVY